MSQTMVANKYIIHDNTLPHLKTVTCINPKCSSNTDGDLFVKAHKLDMDDNSLEDVNEWLLSKQELFVDKEVRVVKVDDDNVILENLLAKNVEKKLLSLKWEKMNKPAKDVIFIKSDAVNLVYTYVCVNCSAQWKNKN